MWNNVFNYLHTSIQLINYIQSNELYTYNFDKKLNVTTIYCVSMYIYTKVLLMSPEFLLKII